MKNSLKVTVRKTCTQKSFVNMYTIVKNLLIDFFKSIQ